MKALARVFVWWINMDNDIEKMVKQCSQCQQVRPTPPLHPWQWPVRPWTRLHIDFAGPVQGKMLLVVVDSHSKWIRSTDNVYNYSRTYDRTVESYVCKMGH